MKTTLPTGEVRFTNGIDYEYYDYIGLQDDKAHRRQKRREWRKRLLSLRLVMCLLVGLAAAVGVFLALMGIASVVYRGYLHLFPQR